MKGAGGIKKLYEILIGKIVRKTEQFIKNIIIRNTNASTCVSNNNAFNEHFNNWTCVF
jgi:hypothetical protein